MQKNRVRRACETCGIVFERPASAVNRPGAGRFCSRPCNRRPAADLFWQYVVKTSAPDACWGWSGATDKGYGRLWSFVYKRPVQAQRVSWEIHFGPIPADMHVCHRCDNPPCTRPDHLFLGTRSENMQDMHGKARYPKVRPFANPPQGEAVKASKLTEENVRAIRARAASGEQAKAIALDYPVSAQTIGYMLRGKTWRHVE